MGQVLETLGYFCFSKPALFFILILYIVNCWVIFMCACMCVPYGMPVGVQGQPPRITTLQPCSSWELNPDCQPWWATSLPRVPTDPTLYIRDDFSSPPAGFCQSHYFKSPSSHRFRNVVIRSNLSLGIAMASLRWTQGLLGLWLVMRHQSHLEILEVVAVLIFGRGIGAWETVLYQNMPGRWQCDLVILCFRWEWTDLFS